MIYILKGKIEIDESPVFIETLKGDFLTVTEIDCENYFTSFETTDEYYKWALINIKDFANAPFKTSIELSDPEPIELIGAFYRRTDQLDENGNYYLEYADQVILNNGILMTKDNYTQYDGSEGWHWYEDGETVSIATPSTWEKIKNFFNIT